VRGRFKIARGRPIVAATTATEAQCFREQKNGNKKEKKQKEE
jgi:hypothetical protein